ncbi:cytochrome c1 [Pseudomonas entomophila]|uniref:cytochrome c1 n=1 Tax=Pseudomonas entomophila TaxID=312306 RepID=UPI0015E398FB|nr:cytochrome c1 [Pseudomonas entomophila]MBA1188628.1 cytochrome c1 [Pseudomonas entomophila]
MRGLLMALMLVCWPVGAWAAPAVLDEARIDLSDRAALQDGARTFVNHCMGCHGMQFQRYEQVADDLGIPPAMMLQNLVFTGARIGDHMVSSLRPEDGKAWFGVAPPDLTLIARVRGDDWLYTYLRSFYEDPSRPLGSNNRVLPGVGMPNVLAGLQGRQVLACAPGGEPAAAGAPCDQLTLVPNSGTLTPRQFDEKIRNLVAFMAYSADPFRLEHRRLGVYVLLYLAVFMALAYLLKRDYWKDVP